MHQLSELEEMKRLIGGGREGGTTIGVFVERYDL